MELLILGASARAAAASAIRAGLSSRTIDLFVDRDLRAIAPAARISIRTYPDGFEALAAEAPPSPWMYTGALENLPDLVDRIARVRPLWGNPGDVLRAVRDPFLVESTLRAAGLPCPEVRRYSDELPDDGSWLAKPLASAGGNRIYPLEGAIWSYFARTSNETALYESQLPSTYFQKRIEGIDLAAIFVADRSDARLLGVTRQWIGGEGSPGAFAYRGSHGPWPLSEEERCRIARLGSALASAFGLAGLFGVDLILREGEPWPVEVNPRYTASVEVLELALGIPALLEHARVFDPSMGEVPSPPDPPRGRQTVVGKVILFAPAECRFPFRWSPSGRQRFADLPDPGTSFDAGDPVMTLIQRANSIEECRGILDRRLRAWSRRLAQDRQGFEPFGT